jgi:hypothetical protein
MTIRFEKGTQVKIKSNVPFLEEHANKVAEVVRSSKFSVIIQIPGEQYQTNVRKDWIERIN